MKTNIVAPIGGLIILAGGLALAFYTGSTAPALAEVNKKTVTKYINLSEKALATGDTKEAEKMIKKALVVDPKNRDAIAGFKKVALASCPKSVAPASSVATPAAAPATVQPTAPAAEPEEEMGCI
jgi:hypothetical protein